MLKNSPSILSSVGTRPAKTGGPNLAGFTDFLVAFLLRILSKLIWNFWPPVYPRNVFNRESPCPRLKCTENGPHHSQYLNTWFTKQINCCVTNQPPSSTNEKTIARSAYTHRNTRTPGFLSIDEIQTIVERIITFPTVRRTLEREMG